MKNIKAAILSLLLMITCVVPQVSFAHSSNSFITQMIHNLLHAHHAFGGLLVLAVLILVFKLRKKLVAKRAQQKR